MADLTLELIVKLVDKASRPAKQISKSLRGMVRGLDDLERQKADQSFRRLEKSMKGVSRQSRTIRDIELGKAFLSSAQGLNSLDRGLQRLFRKPIQDAREFGKAISNVASVVDTSKISIDDIKKASFELAEEFGIEAEDQVNSFYKAFSTGAESAAEATERVRAANVLAVGGVGDLEKTFKLLTSTQDAFGLTAADSTKIADSFFSAVKQGDTNLDQLAGKFGKVSATAGLFGLSLQDTTDLVAAGSRVLPTTAQAVDGLNAALKNISKPSKSAASELQKLFGRKVAKQFESDTKGVLKTFGGVGGVLKEIVSRSDNADTSLKRIFGSIQGLKFAGAITGNEFAILNKVIEENADVTGFAAEAAQKVIDNDPGFALRQQEQRFKKLSVALGNAAIPALTEFLETMQPTVESIADFIKENPKLVGGLAKFAASVFAANLVFGPLLTFFGTGIRLFQTFRGSTDLARIALGKFGKVGKAVQGLTLGPGGAVGAAFSILGAAAIGVQIGTFLDEKFGLSTKLGDVASEQDIQAAQSVETLVDVLNQAQREGASDKELLSLVRANKEAFSEALKESDSGFAGFRQDIRGAITGTDVRESFKTGLEILEGREQRLIKSIERDRARAKARVGDPEAVAEDNASALDMLTSAAAGLDESARKGQKLDITVRDDRVEMQLRRPDGTTQFIEQGTGLTGGG